MASAIDKLLKENPALYKSLVDKLACESSLHYFVKSAWPSMEANPFQDNWHLRNLCEELERITSGENRFLLINLPPRCAKTLVVNVCWPLWTWIQDKKTFTSGNGVRFLCASYGDKLSLDNADKMRDLAMSQWFFETWGDKVKMRQDKSLKSAYGIEGGGARYSTSITGALLGLGGDCIICFPSYEKVWTESGPVPIGEIVRNKKNIRVWSADVSTGNMSLKKITQWHKNPGSEIIEVAFSDGVKIHCTPNHRIWTASRGWVEAVKLRASDMLPCSPVLDGVNKVPANAEFSRRYLVWFSRVKNLHRCFGGNFSPASPYVRFLSKSFGHIFPCHPSANIPDGSFANSILGGKIFCGIPAGDNSDGDFFSYNSSGSALMDGKRPVFFRVSNILRSGSVINIFWNIVARVPVTMAGIVSGRSRANKRDSNGLMNPDTKSFSIFSRIKSKIPPSIIRGFYNFFLNTIGGAAPSRAWTIFAFDAPHIANAIKSFKPRYRSPLFIREIGHVDETFCLSVEDNHTFYVGDRQQYILVKNCDDPHNVESVESDKERESSLRGWRELSSTRLNDPKRTAIVVVMQRLHERDVSGTIISGKDYGKWTHLMYPMRHDTGRHCASDPRAEAGELMWPQRFGETEVEAMERELGPYMASGRLQQSPTPEGGGIIKRDYWKLWPPEGETELPDGELKRNEFPVMDYVIASADTAYTEKEENDFNALAILGLFRHRGLPKIMLMHCWKKHLEFRGGYIARDPDEEAEEYKRRRKKAWGMLEWTAYECHRFNVDRLIIEGRATGITLAQEMRKIYGNEKWPTQLIQPKGSKMARVVSIQPLFAEGMIYAPDRDWSETAILEFEAFPKGAHDDLVDACFVEGTMIATMRGKMPIEKVGIADSVLTPDGWRRVLWSGYTGERSVMMRFGLSGTVNHPIFQLDSSYQEMRYCSERQLLRNDVCGFLKIALLKAYGSTAFGTRSWAEAVNTIYRNQQRIPGEKTLRVFTSLYGSFIRGKKFRKTMIFTISIIIHLIASMKILLAFRAGLMAQWLRRITIRKLTGSGLKNITRRLLHGIDRKKAERGTEGTRRNPLSKKWYLRNIPALGAAGDSSPDACAEPNGVRMAVMLNISGERKTGTGGAARLIVSSAENHSSLKASRRRNFVADSVQGAAGGKPIRVYNLHVEEAECFFANGVLVHNCTHGIAYLRNSGLALRREEVRVSDEELLRYRPTSAPLYDV